jgi:hypothetical protein
MLNVWGSCSADFLKNYGKKIKFKKVIVNEVLTKSRTPI